jgi:hypothetical protein
MKKYSLNGSICKLFTVLFLGINVAQAYEKHIVCRDPEGSQAKINFAFDLTNNMARKEEHTSYLLNVGPNTSDITELAGPKGDREIKKISNNENTDFSLNTIFGAASFVRFYESQLVYLAGKSKHGMDWQFYKLSYANKFLSANGDKERQIQLYPGEKFGPQPPQWHISKDGKEVSQDDWWVLWQGDKNSSLSGIFAKLVCQEVNSCERDLGATKEADSSQPTQSVGYPGTSGYLKKIARGDMVYCEYVVNKTIQW